MDLPILAFENTIVETVNNNAVTVIKAETGAGKSTMVPIMLYQAGYDVVVTEPRRLAARTVAERVADLVRCKLGATVGYHTGEGKSVSSITKILFCTDGLQLVRELSGSGAAGGKKVLVLDEVHEWGQNVETLVAWARQRQEAGDDLKVVLMSATMEADKLSAFYGGAPVITVPGRTFSVKRDSVKTSDLVDAVVAYAIQKKNVLVFQPGKKEISDTVDEIRLRLGISAVVLPLHGEVDPADQKRCFESAPAGRVKVVVATNVAQTSITIPDIDAVVDSGMERRIELKDGIEGLALVPISQADCNQRAGRAGRTKEGYYTLASDVPWEDRPAFPKAEILRSRLDLLVLRLAVQNFDATALRFFHQPDMEELRRAREVLMLLGAMTSEGTVTDIGHKMSRMPLSVEFSRMLIEAEKLGVVEQVATIAACLEAGNILMRDGAWKAHTKERSSDLMALLDVYRAGVKVITTNASSNTPRGMSKADMLRSIGIFPRDFYRARELREKILQVCPRRQVTTPDPLLILQACVSGMIANLHKGPYSYISVYRPGVARNIARESVVTGSYSALAVGVPFDITGKDKYGRKFVINILSMVTTVTIDLLRKAAPHLMQEVEVSGTLEYDCVLDMTTVMKNVTFNGIPVYEDRVECANHPNASEILCKWLADDITYRRSHFWFIGQNIGFMDAVRPYFDQMGVNKAMSLALGVGELHEWFAKALGGVSRLRDIPIDALTFPMPDMAALKGAGSLRPNVISVDGREYVVRYKGWANESGTPLIHMFGSDFIKLDALPVLPDGETVAVYISDRLRTARSNEEMHTIRNVFLEEENAKVFRAWVAKQNDVSFPLDGDEIPTIEPRQYGVCAITGASLFAYGAVILNGTRMYVNWHTKKDDADRDRDYYGRAIAERMTWARTQAAQQYVTADLDRLYKTAKRDDMYKLDTMTARLAKMREYTTAENEETLAAGRTLVKELTEKLPVVKSGGVDMSGLAALGKVHQKR